jgi:hypothetical protein
LGWPNGFVTRLKLRTREFSRVFTKLALLGTTSPSRSEPLVAKQPRRQFRYAFLDHKQILQGFFKAAMNNAAFKELFQKTIKSCENG